MLLSPSPLLACSWRRGAGSGDPGASGAGEDPPAAARRPRGSRRRRPPAPPGAAEGGGGSAAASPARRRQRALPAAPPRPPLPRPGLRGGAAARGRAARGRPSAAVGGAALLLHGTRAEPQRLLRLPQHLRRAGTGSAPRWVSPFPRVPSGSRCCGELPRCPLPQGVPLSSRLRAGGDAPWRQKEAVGLGRRLPSAFHLSTSPKRLASAPHLRAFPHSLPSVPPLSPLSRAVSPVSPRESFSVSPWELPPHPNV